MIKVGLIGCGFMGGMHSACYNVIEGVEVTAVADVRKEKAEEIAKVHGAEIFATGDELIANADVDVVDICLPTYLHTSHAVSAMKKGKNVFVEKPLCINREEAELLLKTEKETGAKVQVGQVYVFGMNMYGLRKRQTAASTAKLSLQCSEDSAISPHGVGKIGFMMLPRAVLWHLICTSTM